MIEEMVESGINVDNVKLYDDHDEPNDQEQSAANQLEPVLICNAY
mgnify:CR=1 FL=1